MGQIIKQGLGVGQGAALEGGNNKIDHEDGEAGEVGLDNGAVEGVEVALGEERRAAAALRDPEKESTRPIIGANELGNLKLPLDKALVFRNRMAKFSPTSRGTKKISFYT